MKSDLLSLSKLFTEVLLRIPDYQRGYAWATKQLKDFWNDIEQLEDGSNHYTGVLTLQDVPASIYRRWNDDLWIIESKRYQPYYVVDGQQRLTTAMILIQALLEQLPDDQRLNYNTKEEIRKKFIFESRDGGISRSFLFGYEKDNPSYEYLKQLILMTYSDSHSVAENTIYTKNLANAKKYFSSKLKGLSVERLESVYQKLTQHFLFNVYAIMSDIDVHVTFETMNNRGKRLSNLELLKNRLIFLTTRLPDAPQEKNTLRGVINECWKTVYYYLGRNEDNPLNDDLFLALHYALHSGLFSLKYERPTDDKRAADGESEDLDDDDDDDEDDGNYATLLLERHFTVRNVIPLDDEHPAKLTLKSLYDYAHSMKGTVHAYYQMMNPADSGWPHNEIMVMEQILRIASPGAAEYLPILAILIKKTGSQTERVTLLKSLERMLFLQSMVSYTPEHRFWNSRKLAEQVMTDGIDVAQVLASVQKHIDVLMKFVVTNNVLSHWASKPTGFYQWRHLKYFLFEYEQKLRTSSKDGREKLHWKEFLGERHGTSYNTIEHIYPKKSSGEYWKRKFKGFSTREKNLLRNSIGNLLPMSRPKNSSLGNRPFHEKKGSATHPVGYAYGCYSENEISFCKDWTAQEILERGIVLLSFLEERWGIPTGDRLAKIKTLRLEFVLDFQES